MSFKHNQPVLFDQIAHDAIADDFLSRVEKIVCSAQENLAGKIHVYNGNACYIHNIVSKSYDCVITSPPYPNRMSYIRELRPYMYWLGFLEKAHEAGELDWETTGGTWGVATSRLQKWFPYDIPVCLDGIEEIVDAIRKNSVVLANYIHKYFHDIAIHISNIYHVLTSHAKVFYVIGNSTFYNNLVPTDKIYENILRQSGFKNVETVLLRKRNSKKELYEFLVSGEKN